MVILLMIFGALLGLAAHEASGALLGATIGWLVARAIRQERRIALLERQLGGRADGATAPVAARPIEVAAPAAAKQAVDALAASSLPLSPPRPPLPQGAAVPAARVDALDSDAPATRPPPPADEPGPLDVVRRWVLGGNMIVNAGIAILFIGLAFLARYLTEHVTVPVELRLAGIALVAIVLTAVGWRLRTRRTAYAQVLQGGGIAVLYLTLFVSFRWYGVLGMASAFVLMAVVAALAAALAVLQEAPALAVVGALGGFATPLLLSTGAGNHVALFSYYLLLDLGIAAIAWFRTWRALNLIGFAFTFGVGGLWGLTKYQPDNYASAQAFLIIFFLVFVAVLVLPARRVTAGGDSSPYARWINGSLLFGLPTIVFALQHALVHELRYGSAFAALLLAAFYIGLACWLRSRPQARVLFESALAIATVLLTLVIPLAFDAHSTAGAWALEGAGLVWLGFRQRRRGARAFGYALLLIAGLLLLQAAYRGGLPERWLNATMLSALLLIAGALLAALSIARQSPPPAREADLERLLVGYGLLVALLTGALHLGALVAPEARLAGIIAGLAALALLHTLLAARLAWPGVAWPALGLAPALLLCAGVSALFQDHPLHNHGGWAWPLAVAAHLATLRYAAPHWNERGAQLAHASGVLVLAALGALLGRALTRGLGDLGSAWPWLGWLAVPAALLLLLPRRAFSRRWPASAAPDAYQCHAGAVLAAVLVVWTFAANVLSNGSAQPLPYLPLLSPLDLGVATALFAAWRWSVSEGASALRRGQPRLAPAALGGAGFVWLNAMLVRGFHHHGGVPFRFDAWSHSLAVQTGFTLLWTISALALMWFGTRQARRGQWLVGAALLGVVVLKLLLVDLSGGGTVTRIVSFIGAGVLMLVIGYVAPLPAREEGDA